MTATLDTWAEGTIESLNRQRRSTANIKRLEQENAILRDQLTQARARIADLESQISVGTTEGSGAGAQRAVSLPTPEPKLVNQTEAAHILDVHPSTISRWVAAGHFSLHQSSHRAKPLIDAATLHRPPRKKRGRKEIS